MTALIGEPSWRIREAVAGSFEWLGLEFDRARNRASAPIISSERSRVQVFIVPTDEEIMIARHTWRLMAGAGAAAA